MEVFDVGSDQIKIVTKANWFGYIREREDWRQGRIDVVGLGIVKLGAAVEAGSGAVWEVKGKHTGQTTKETR